MWFFTREGFISVVADRADPSGKRLLVRARRREHLERWFPQAEVFSVTPRDYEWRAWVPRSDVARAAATAAEAIAYTNFKATIHDPSYHDVCLDVWAAMRRIE